MLECFVYVYVLYVCVPSLISKVRLFIAMKFKNKKILFDILQIELLWQKLYMFKTHCDTSLQAFKYCGKFVCLLCYHLQ